MEGSVWITHSLRNIYRKMPGEFKTVASIFIWGSSHWSIELAMELKPFPSNGHSSYRVLRLCGFKRQTTWVSWCNPSTDCPEISVQSSSACLPTAPCPHTLSGLWGPWHESTELHCAPKALSILITLNLFCWQRKDVARDTFNKKPQYSDALRNCIWFHMREINTTMDFTNEKKVHQ